MFWRRTRRDEGPDVQAPTEVDGPAPADATDGSAVETRQQSATPDDPRPDAPRLDGSLPLTPVQAGLSRPAGFWGSGGGPSPTRFTPVTPEAVSAQESARSASIGDGVAASRSGFMARLHGILRSGVADEETWEQVEETLIAGDVGARLAMDVVSRARSRRSPGGPESAVRAELERLLPPGASGPWRPVRPDPREPAVVLVVGVNGTGKTTSIAKIAARLSAEGDSVILAAADTFRAAATEQLQSWADRLRLPLVAHKAGADPSAVVFDALDAAVARRADVVIVDTAGRLHTRHNLMEELAKIRRTIDKRLPGATPEVLFVLDATTGQNGLAQAKAFHEASRLTGIVLTKLDSTAKGGIVFAIEEALGVPVVFAGVGEGVSDLVNFNPAAFVEALFA
ncbi:MAG: signal recognition particle-docking protein FtsY [Candidatus Limnocylindrales bacterium]